MPKEIDNGGPAFPHGPLGDSWQHGDGRITHQLDGHPGMELRDYFAAAAMQGMCARSFPLNDDKWVKPFVDYVVPAAYEIADAMIAARKEGK